MIEPSALFQLVVVGSSAGGIEALSTLVATLPETFAAPLVIAQHLDPSRPSHLGEILTRRAHLPVITVQDQEPLRPSTIYVVPSNSHVQISDHDITLLPDSGGRPKPSVDLLLASAAAVFGEQLIAVILTGTGSDGTVGAHAVKQAGGTVVIQNPTTAAYPGMPQSIAPQMVDIVADLERIGPILGNLLQGVGVPTRPDTESDLQRFLDQVRERSGVDFRSYKTGTILRRLQRRIAATDTCDLAGYQAYLQTHPEEYHRLVSSFLIKVTQFLRDPELFAYVHEHLLPDLIVTSRSHEHELRIWSAGCATGEEAYSLAILLCDLLGEELERFTVKIFATDLDADAIAFARRGVYPADALSHLPGHLVANYFNELNGFYTVQKRVRSLVVFGEHDLGQRAPFPRIDLVMCRNVLIYFTKELQQRALNLFAFALREGGYLMLGKTETISPLDAFFTPQQPQYKIYCRQGPRPPTPPLRLVSDMPQSVQRSAQRQRRDATQELFAIHRQLQQTRSSKENLLLNLPVGVVVVNRRYDIQEINAAARRLLAIRTPAIGEDFVHLAQHVSHRKLRAAIDRAIRDSTVSGLDEVTVEDLTTGEPTYLQITCYPQALGEVPTESALILVTDITALTLSRREMEQALAQQASTAAELQRSVIDLQRANVTLARRNDELAQANTALEHAHRQAEAVAAQHLRQMERLVAANRELITANEELTAANVDLRMANNDFLLTGAEGQAAIEEVETLNEELQATNEELETLNEELQATIEELITANADLVARGEELETLASELQTQQHHSARAARQLEAILAGMADAVLVVTPMGESLLTNAAYTRLFGNGAAALADEAEQPLSPMATPQARAARGETFSTTVTQKMPDGTRRWFEAIGRPVEGDAAPRLGVVVIRDITERSLRRLQEDFLALASHELKTPLTTIQGHLEQLTHWLAAGAEHKRPRHAAAVALDQAHRLARLIDDLLDVTRLHSGKFSLQRWPVQMDALLAQTVDIAQTLSTHQTITLATEGGPLSVHGDAARLQQVVLNLLTNAITHAATSDRIDVRLRPVGQMAEITVQDYGAGIPASDLPNLFARFYQVSHARSGQGLGLGLFICQQIVIAHGGTITVSSIVGAGTTFCVQLPLLELDSAPAQADIVQA